MAERYTKKYVLDSFLHAKDAPVVICGGALLSDSFTHSTLVHLKLTSLTDKTIKAVNLVIEPRDSTGESPWKPIEYQYKELEIHQGESFGKKAAIVMPDSMVSSFTLTVTKVEFDDGSSWDGTGSQWETLAAPRTITEALNDKEISRQFAIRYGSDCKYLPEDDGDLWYCACGAINLLSEAKCYRCRRVYSALKGINLASLRSETAQRVETEKREDDEQKAEQSRKKSLAIKLSLVLVPVLIVLILLLATVPGYLAQKNAYAEANAYLSAGDYDKALKAFSGLGDYLDSREQVEQNIPYLKAVYIMDCAKTSDVKGLLALDMKRSELAEDESVSVALYKKAAEMFNALGDYKDSAARSKTAVAAVNSYYDGQKQDAYNSAAALLEEGRFLEARDAFQAMGDYSNSSEMAVECLYRRAVLLYDLTEKYFMAGVSANISSDAAEKSVFYITKSAFTSLGKEISSDIREICREDGVEINISDSPETGVFPVCTVISQLFTALGDYKDSAEYAKKALENGDFTKPFYEYCESGQLYEAYVWLTEYNDEFEYREQWLGLLQSCIPYCGTWALPHGNPNLLPMTRGAGPEIKCSNFTSLVTINGSTIQLQLTMAGMEAYPIVMEQRVGGSGFSVCPDGFNTFVAVITDKGLFQYSRYVNSGLQAGPDACEYSRAA